MLAHKSLIQSAKRRLRPAAAEKVIIKSIDYRKNMSDFTAAKNILMNAVLQRKRHGISHGAVSNNIVNMRMRLRVL